MVRRLGLGKNNHLTYASLALNPRNANHSGPDTFSDQVSGHHWSMPLTSFYTTDKVCAIYK